MSNQTELNVCVPSSHIHKDTPMGVVWEKKMQPNSYVETITPKVTIFGDGAYKEVIKVK